MYLLPNQKSFTEKVIHLQTTLIFVGTFCLNESRVIVAKMALVGCGNLGLLNGELWPPKILKFLQD